MPQFSLTYPRSKIALLIVSLLGAGLLVWHPIRWWFGDRFFPVRLLNYMTPWLLIILLPVLLFIGVAQRQRTWWLIVGLLMLVICMPILPLYIPQLGNQPPVSQSLKVMSFSVCSANRRIPAIVRIIRQAQPDLLLLQEIRNDVAESLYAELSDLYPGSEAHFVYAPEVQQMIVSRYVLTQTSVDPEQGRAQKARMDTPSGYIEVWNVHVNQPEFWRQDYMRHHNQLVALAQSIRTVDGPLIVGGDFNTTERSDPYRLIAQSLISAHHEAGWGFGFSFPAVAPDVECRLAGYLPILWPLVRIDHIFVSRHLFPRKAGTLSEPGGSDHLPIVAEIGVKE